jgi:hypothetical protein
MIDLTNKPEGATNYVHGAGKDSIMFMKDVSDNSYLWWNTAKSGWSIGDLAYDISECRPIEPDWSIHNNTLPLSELSDEQRGLLFNHWCNVNTMQIERDDGWHDMRVQSWNRESTYRAKQKTERELFIEAAFNTCPVFIETKYDHEQLLNAMFEVGFKAPKGK